MLKGEREREMRSIRFESRESSPDLGAEKDAHEEELDDPEGDEDGFEPRGSPAGFFCHYCYDGGGFSRIVDRFEM